MSKKTENIGFRQTPEEKALLTRIADEMETSPGSLASSIISRFLKARLEHGNRLVWPPEFNYYPASSKSVQEKTDSPANS
ncbi:MAG: hypothetical protein KAU94_10535 [Verrucomicrobia bacterium]|nr:hypothetical protein [Verrucomicrobiota bacterium]